MKLRRFVSIVVIALLAVSFAAATLAQTPGGRPSAYTTVAGDDLWTLAEVNRFLAEEQGRGAEARTWQSVRQFNPSLRSVPVVMKNGRPYVKLMQGVDVEGLPFLAQDPDAVDRYLNTGSVAKSRQPTENTTIKVGGEVTEGEAFDLWTSPYLPVIAVAALLLAGALIYFGIIRPRRLAQAREVNEEAAEPIEAQPSRIDPEFDGEPEYQGLGAPNLEDHIAASNSFAYDLGLRDFGNRMIVGVTVTGGVWPTRFRGGEVLQAQPDQNRLIVGIYYNDDGGIDRTTLHWRYCTNRIPLNQLSDAEMHFITADTVFSNAEILDNPREHPLNWFDVESYLREHFGVREAAAETTEEAPVAATPETDADAVHFSFAGTKKEPVLTIAFAGRSMTFVDPVTVFVDRAGNMTSDARPRSRYDGFLFVVDDVHLGINMNGASIGIVGLKRSGTISANGTMTLEAPPVREHRLPAVTPPVIAEASRTSDTSEAVN